MLTGLHGYPRFTSDIDLVINLEQKEAEKAIQAITSYGLKTLLPVDPMLFADKKSR